jgi:7,8-dihydroneopterin aldolase/epimerase/oxygenase
VSDRIVLHDIRLEGRHGNNPGEQDHPQPFEVDVELELDLRPAGEADDLARTVDYGRVYDIVRDVVERRSYRLIEAIAEAISRDLLAEMPADAAVVRVRKPGVRLGGPLADAAVEIRRTRP